MVNMSCSHNNSNTNINLFGNDCVKCGLLINYADDSTIILQTTKDDANFTSYLLDQILNRIEVFLSINNLKINIDKTQLLRTTSRQQLAHNRGERVLLSTLDSKGNRIKPSSTSKILGLTFTSNLTWLPHLDKGADSILNKCKQKLAALKFVASNCSLHEKKLLADACIMSRIIFGIQIWGNNLGPTVINRAQIVQNQVACWITGSHRLTKTSLLLSKLKWMSVNQLTCYHSLILIWKVLRNRTPLKNYNSLIKNRNKVGRIDLVRNTWSMNPQKLYWTLPQDIINIQKISHFKAKLRKWITTNIPIGDKYT